ncbi:hypothetical protein EZV62_005418 [Acer yangbiense]|uniref:Uncharacterized protein n=1 Tax=Acer yangbiense TaxID=1000413 RepID=A0A5C7IMB4_9ROSI|nr:hypothetical protein EZV62_005418 [Acer yangbiense]
MEMKKISCAVLIAAASMSAAMAAETFNSAAPAPGPNTAASGAAAALPIFGSLVGASLVSFFAYYLQWENPSNLIIIHHTQLSQLGQKLTSKPVVDSIVHAVPDGLTKSGSHCWPSFADSDNSTLTPDSFTEMAAT